MTICGGDVRTLVASCRSFSDPYRNAWLSELLDASTALDLEVVILEQCADVAGPDRALRNNRSARVHMIDVQRCGREAFSYLWYITSCWNNLPRTMVFMQGDAHVHHHVHAWVALRSVQRVRDGILQFEHLEGSGWVTLPTRYMSRLPPHSFMVEHGHDSSSALPSLVCGLAHRLTSVQGQPCPLWTAVNFAHFTASRHAVLSRSLGDYRWLMRFFLAANGSCIDDSRHGHSSASLIEYTWSLVFRCSQLVCGNGRRDQIPATDAACRRYSAPFSFDPQNSSSLTERPLVAGEPNPLGCTRLHFV